RLAVADVSQPRRPLACAVAESRRKAAEQAQIALGQRQSFETGKAQAQAESSRLRGALAELEQPEQADGVPTPQRRHLEQQMGDALATGWPQQQRLRLVDGSHGLAPTSVAIAAASMPG